jgi:hypothetical protein
MDRCHNEEFCDRGIVLRLDINSHNRFTDSLHQPQKQKLHHLYKFHLQVGLEPCTSLNALLAQLYGQRSADNIHICEVLGSDIHEERVRSTKLQLYVYRIL